MVDTTFIAKSTIDEIIEELIDNFNAAKELGNEFLYQTLIDYGKFIGDYPKALMTDEFKIHNCQSTVYIQGLVKNNRLYLQGYADSKLVQGQVAVLLKIFNGQKVDEILNSDDSLKRFVQETNIIATLTPSRQNAFGSMFEHIKRLAKKQ